MNEIIKDVAEIVMEWTRENIKDRKDICWNDKYFIITISEDPNFLNKVEPFDPINNYNHTILIINKMIEDGYRIDITIEKNYFHVLCMGMLKGVGSYNSDDFGFCVCVAALFAKGSYKEYNK